MSRSPALIRLIQKLETLGPEKPQKRYKLHRGAILSIILDIFREDPEEFLTLSDIYLKFELLDRRGVVFALGQGLKLGFITGTIQVGDSIELIFRAGPNIDFSVTGNAGLKKSRIRERLRVDSLAYKTVSRLKADRKLRLSSKELGITRNFYSIFAIPIKANWISVEKEDRKSFVVAGPRIDTFNPQTEKQTAEAICKKLQPLFKNADISENGVTVTLSEIELDVLVTSLRKTINSKH